MATVGQEVFRRFDMLLDYPARKAYLSPSKSFNYVNQLNLSGVDVGFDGKNSVVEDVTPGSPGANANLVEGDIIESINGIPTQSMHPFDVNFYGPVGTIYRIKVIKASGVRVAVTMRITDS